MMMVRELGLTGTGSVSAYTQGAAAPLVIRGPVPLPLMLAIRVLNDRHEFHSARMARRASPSPSKAVVPEIKMSSSGFTGKPKPPALRCFLVVAQPKEPQCT